ncbi:MAG: carbonic anhydrase [Saprospiraceae bacterium]|nr:carbonic anhydrase [Saprospiraceae bacterium]
MNGFKKSSRSISALFAVAVVLLLSNCNLEHQATTDVHTPESALQRLEDGNRRFLVGQTKHPHQTKQRILETQNGQHPFAVVVTCSDSRVSPEIIFDEGLGDLFVIRTAGNLMSDLELGSIEYAVEHLGATLVVVLGHTECGAVKAFVEGGEACGHIKDIVDALADEQEEQQVLRLEGKNLQACIEGNILHGVKQLEQDEPVLAGKIRQNKLAVVPMIYDVHDGKVTKLNRDELQLKLNPASASDDVNPE